MLQAMKRIESIYEAANNRCIRTFTGKSFDILKPELDIEDIAHSLSHLCRYNGHCSRFYSVADHSMMVCHIMGFKLEGLLHDASEAYLSDVPAPVKQLLPDWKKLEDHLDYEVRKTWNLPITETEECKRADRLALFIEAYQLQRNRGADFLDPDGIRDEAIALLEAKPEFQMDNWITTPENSKRCFLEFFHDLVNLGGAYVYT
jgi:5'-deoxynucleotidase YfbR-like HD superfamily hydrolase